MIEFLTVEGDIVKVNKDKSSLQLIGKSNKHCHWGWYLFALLFFWPWCIVLYFMKKEHHTVLVRSGAYKMNKYYLDEREYYKLYEAHREFISQKGG